MVYMLLCIIHLIKSELAERNIRKSIDKHHINIKNMLMLKQYIYVYRFTNIIANKTISTTYSRLTNIWVFKIYVHYLPVGYIPQLIIPMITLLLVLFYYFYLFLYHTAKTVKAAFM